MAASRWYFSREQIRNSPSVRSGIEYAKELGYRQQCANFIQDIGQRLTVNQLCINTSIVYMHRFYMFHSFKDFHRNVMAPCFLFLGAKVEEQPRKLEHVLKVAYRHLHKDSDAQLDTQSDQYMQMAQDLIDNESILLQTLGFELSVEHPHTYVVKCAQMVKAAKDLAQTSYFLATNSLHLTTFCIEKRPTVVACVCIYVACKWTSYEIPESSHDKKHWWEYMDNEVTLAQIEDMTAHFIKILDSCPARLKKKISAGPVIYKGGVLQLKRENDDESSTTEKHNKESSSKTSTKEKDSSSSTEKHSVKNENSSDSSKLKERKEHSSMSLHSSHKHSKNPDIAKNLDSEKKHAEHQKHRSDHKHRHAEHNKHHGEQSKQDSVNKQSAKTRPEQKDSTIKIPEIKSSSSISRPVEKSSTKEKATEEPSAAAKLILSLPPLQHKHSLPDQDQSSESPAKKKKLETGAVPVKNPKLELESTKHHAKEHGLPGSSHHKHQKSSHSKSSSKDKRKEKIPSDRHSSSHQHKQQASHKSSHSQKHHSKSQRDMAASSSASDASVSESPIKKTVLDVGLKRDDQTIKTPSKHHQVLKTPQKNQGSVKLTPKPSKNPDELLPPPPPPPSVDMMSMLSSPPLPAAPPPGTPDLYGKQGITPSKSQVVTTPQYGIQPDAALLPNQGQLHQVQQPNSVLPMTPIKTPLAGQSYQQQPQFISTSQSTTSNAANYGINPMYYQGQEGQSFPPPSHNANLFSSQGVNLIPPPLPPPGMILKQVSGLPPPPPPLNMPFPPPP